MMQRRGGGSQTTVPLRKRLKGPDRQEAARLRAIAKLGEDVVNKIRSDWDSWDTSYGGKEWQQSEGVVLSLLQQLSDREIRSILPIGGSRVTRLRKSLKSGVEHFHTRRAAPKPWHAFDDVVLEAFKGHCATWILEDGFPCPHRRPRQYFTEQNLTWRTVHARYEDDTKRADPDARTMSYERFTQYVHFYYPGVRLTRTKVDECDCCVRLDIMLQQPDLTDAEKDAIILRKSTHIDEAIAQRRFVSKFVKEFSALHAPEQNLPETIIPDTFDDDDDASNDDKVSEDEITVIPKPQQVQIQAEDYGSGISMPHYGHSRPSADYFNSNLIIQNFVVANITNNTNHVYFYDERAQGKNADALCSLRLLHHLSTLQKNARNGVPPPDISFSILDNCVGQNKSKIVMMFFAMLSVVFPYRKVVLCFLLPGHSHNIADRVIAWCRRAVHKQNVYTPAGLVEEVNKVKSVEGVFLDHNDSSRPFFTGWGALLAKYFTAPPAGYTSNYLFEIDEGLCTARKTVNTPDDESIAFSMISQSNLATIRQAVIAELFGQNIRSIWEASIASVQLPRHQTKELPEKKQKSLAAKYFSIPKKYLNYYPAVPEAVLNAPEIADEDADPSTTDRPTAKRRPGRPKNKKTNLKASQPSILQFFAAKPKPTST